MRILCIDIGSGTQDVLFLDTAQEPENAVQLILPAPTVLVAKRIESATANRESLLLTGETMGGGACTQALKKHLQEGCQVYAFPGAAMTFNDDLEEIASWGVRIVAPDEAVHLKVDIVIKMGDIDLDIMSKALSHWEVALNPDVIAVAVLDHGFSSLNKSQRLARFQYLRCILQGSKSLQDLVFTSTNLPGYFTRMKAVERSLGNQLPLIMMDTGAAAVLGTSLDRVVANHPHRLVANLGNSHTIAFLLDGTKILGFFEHHTGRLSVEKLEGLFGKLIFGKLSGEEVWKDGGHGSLIFNRGDNPFLVATGPRRSLLMLSRLNPYFAAPFGSMMLTGCYGLVQAAAFAFTKCRTEIESALMPDIDSFNL